jgi:hypothetical protein
VHLRLVLDDSKQDLLAKEKITKYAGTDEMNRKIIIVVSLLAILVIILAYIILTSPASSTVLSVDPQTVQGVMGKNFTISISISNVSDLYGWELKLRWNSSLLDLTNIAEGPILRSKGSTFFSPKVNSTEGHLIADCTLLGDIPGFSGQGTLMTIQFYVKENGACDLNLYDTQLLNSMRQLITYTVHDGHFIA